jgi:hypothetical protein
MGVYSDFRKGLSPAWLRKAWGDRWNEACGSVEDGLLSRLIQSLKARHPSYAPEGALDLIGEDRSLERAPGEPSDVYRLRLKGALAAWRTAGTAKGLLENGLAPMGYATPAGESTVRIIRNRDWATLPEGAANIPDGNTALWARFWLVITRPPQYEPRTWTEMNAFGFSDTATFGTDATLAQARLLRRIVEQWRPAHASFMGAFVVPLAGPVTFDPLPPPGGSRWLEHNATFSGGTPCDFWRFGNRIHLIP